MIKKNQIHPVSRNGTKFNKSQQTDHYISCKMETTCIIIKIMNTLYQEERKVGLSKEFDSVKMQLV